MKVSSIFSSSSLIFSCHLLHTSLALAALSLVNAHATANATLDFPLGSPPDPYQMRVPNTDTSVIFAKYGPAVSAFNLAGILEKAQYETVKSVIAAKGDGEIAQPTFEWRHGRLYVRVDQHQLDMRWETMAEALHGLMEFGWTYAFVEFEFTVLDDRQGVVGSGSVGTGYR